MRLLLATRTHLPYITTQSTIRGVNDRVYSSHDVHLDNRCCGTHFTTGFGTLPSLRAFLGADLHPAFLYLPACLAGDDTYNLDEDSSRGHSYHQSRDWFGFLYTFPYLHRRVWWLTSAVTVLYAGNSFEYRSSLPSIHPTYLFEGFDTLPSVRHWWSPSTKALARDSQAAYRDTQI